MALDCLAKKKSRGRHLQKLYSEAYGKCWLMPVEKLIESICVYADLWVGNQFCATSEQSLFNKFAGTSTIEASLGLNGDWLKKYVSHSLRRAHDSCIARVVESGEIECFGKRAVVTSDGEQQ